jgi:hypothetical protein
MPKVHNCPSGEIWPNLVTLYASSVLEGERGCPFRLDFNSEEIRRGPSELPTWFKLHIRELDRFIDNKTFFFATRNVPAFYSSIFGNSLLKNLCRLPRVETCYVHMYIRSVDLQVVECQNVE